MSYKSYRSWFAWKIKGGSACLRVLPASALNRIRMNLTI